MSTAWEVSTKSLSFILVSSLFAIGCGPNLKTHLNDLNDNAITNFSETKTLEAKELSATQNLKTETLAPAAAPSTVPSTSSAAAAPAPTTPAAAAAPSLPKLNLPENKSTTPNPLKPETQALYKKLLDFRHPKNASIKIPPKAAEKFLRFLEENRNKTFETKTYDHTIGVKFDNLKYGVIIDYTAPSTRRRLFFVDLNSGEVSAYYVAHGKGSVASAKDLSKWSQAEYFSNTEDSKASSLGFFISGESYDGKHGLSLRLHGIEKSNSRAFDRAIVMHGAEYVGEDVLAANGNRYMGMSWGCPALGQGAANKLIPLLAGGALIFSYHETNTPVAETKPYLLEPPKILAMILKSMPNQGPISIGKLELPKPEEDTTENEMPGEDHSPGAQAGNSKVKESEKD